MLICIFYLQHFCFEILKLRLLSKDICNVIHQLLDVTVGGFYLLRIRCLGKKKASVSVEDLEFGTIFSPVPLISVEILEKK